MTEKDVFGVKKELQNTIKGKFGFAKDVRYTGVVALQDEKVLEKLVEGLGYLPLNFIVVSSQLSTSSNNIALVKKVDSGLIPGLDFIICDDESEKISEYLKNGVIPVIYKENHLKALLSEFNPMKNEGNAFLYDAYNAWSIFYAMARYMENTKFPFDYRNLVKNVLKIQ